MAAEAQSSTEVLRDGSRVTIRPILKQDIELERNFIERLTPQSRRFRFLCSLGTASDSLLAMLTDIDVEHEAALIALIEESGRQREVGVARFSSLADGNAEVAVTVSDDWQHKGLGTALMKRLIEVARKRGIDGLYSVDSADNSAMRELAECLGFERKPDPDDATQVIHTLDLRRGRAEPERVGYHGN